MVSSAHKTLYTPYSTELLAQPSTQAKVTGFNLLAPIRIRSQRIRKPKFNWKIPQSIFIQSLCDAVILVLFNSH